MGNKLMVRFRKVLERNQPNDRKVKSITYASEVNSKYPSIETEGHDTVVDNLGNFTRNASISVRSSKVLGNKVSLNISQQTFRFMLMTPLH